MFSGFKESIMAGSNFIKKIALALGKNNKPYYAMMIIGAFEGVFRPIFTMMDKKKDPESKKYAATREALTEGIAIFAYWGLGAGAGKLANLFKTEEHRVNGKANLMLLGTCIAAMFVIPGLCSLAIKPFMDKYIRTKPTQPLNNPAPEQLSSWIAKQNNLSSLRDTYSAITYQPRYNMKVGGV